MVKVSDIYKIIDEFAPFHLAESWDNVGLLVGDMGDPISGVILALDVTGKVVEEAIKENANLIITHHPLIFHPLTSISSKDLVYKLIKNNIAVISAHTNLDKADRGVNYALAKALKLKDIEKFSPLNKDNYLNIKVYLPSTHIEEVYSAMISAGGGEIGEYSGCGFISEGEGRFTPNLISKPFIGEQDKLVKAEEVKLEMQLPADKLSSIIAAIKKTHPYEEPVFLVTKDEHRTHNYTYGRVGRLESKMTPRQLADFAKEILCATAVRFTGGSSEISRVAVMGGSGGDFLGEAIALGAHAFITGEVKHNHLLDANENGVTIIDVGHFASENIVMPELKKLLQEKIHIKVEISKTGTDGIIGMV